MNLVDLLPKWLADRIAAMTRTDDALEAVSRLCSMRMTELALITLQGAMNPRGEGLEVVPISMKLDACFVIDEDEHHGYVVLEGEHGGARDIVCIAFEQHEVSEGGIEEGGEYVRRWITFRPCTRNEYEYVETLVEGSEKSVFVKMESA